jgi:hypothetical protein
MMADDLDLLMKLDRLVTSEDPTVMDALKSALVLVEMAEDPPADTGPLMRMHRKLIDMQYQIDFLNGKLAGLAQTNPYQGVTWTDNTTGWPVNQWSDPTRNYPHGYKWDDISKSVIEVTSDTGP